jgi:peptide chain release factor subunit 1
MFRAALAGETQPMQTDELTPERLRRLAELRPEGGRVLSVYLNLEPTEFATPAARSSAIGSLIDEAGRQVKATTGLSHDERRDLEEDVKRVRDYLRGPSFSADGAHGLAIFCSRPAGLFEILKLPRPVDSGVLIDDSPWVEPLAGAMSTGRWCVLLANRRTARLFEGQRDTLEEVKSFAEDVRGQSDTGGWSQARFERSQAEEHEENLRRAAYEAFKRFRASPFDHFLVGTPAELRGSIEQHLHSSLRERLRGFVEIDVEHSSADDVVRAASAEIEEAERRREREGLDRLIEGVSTGGRGAAGLDETLGALNERRVETLMFDEGFSAPGAVCASCGFVAARDGGACPVDGGELVPRADVLESAIELALGQSAEVLVVRHHDDLGAHGSIGAVLRF